VANLVLVAAEVDCVESEEVVGSVRIQAFVIASEVGEKGSPLSDSHPGDVALVSVLDHLGVGQVVGYVVVRL